VLRKDFLVFHGLFEDISDVLGRFGIDASELEGCEVLFAAYECDYEGQASCYGLEEQWEPEETTVEALQHRVERGTLGYFLGGYSADFCRMLEQLSRTALELKS
jgi:hypothetical protein